MTLSDRERRGRRVSTTLPLAALLLASCGASHAASNLGSFEVADDTPVVLIVIDTLRADHLSCYGYPLETSPVLDELASQAHLFLSNATQYNSTFPSLTSILTGLYVKSHRNYISVPVKGQTNSTEGAMSLANRLGDEGYYNVAAVSHPSWADADPNALVLKGWDELSFIGEPIPVMERPDWTTAAYTNERLFPLLDKYEEAASDRPLFLWAHYFDPHTAYDPPKDVLNMFLEHHLAEFGLERFTDQLAAIPPKERREWIKQNVPPALKKEITLANGRALYDEEIRSCDAGIGKLFDRLDGMGILDEAIIIVMADHGENMEFQRHGKDSISFTHQRLYEGVTRTPLIIKLPGQTQGTRIDALTQNIDVVPTLMQVRNLRARPAVDGQSLVPLMRGEADGLHDFVYSESSDYEGIAVKTPDLKLIDSGEGKEAQLFKWREDLGEEQNLVGIVDDSKLSPLQGAVRRFRPADALKILITPDDEPYEGSLRLRLTDSFITDVVGESSVVVDDDGAGFVWEGRIDRSKVEFLAFISKRNAEMTWTVSRSGVEDASSVVWIGDKPLRRTSAIPAWIASEASAPEKPHVILKDGPRENSFIVRANPASGSRADVEFRYSKPGYKLKFEQLKATGFGPLVEQKQMVFTMDSKVMPAQATVRHKRGHTDLLKLVRIDGGWPDLSRVAIGDKAMRTDELTFVFPHPFDGRLTSYLLTGGGADAPRGAFVIGMETSVGGTTIDASQLSPELVEQLQSLGYIDGGEDH